MVMYYIKTLWVILIQSGSVSTVSRLKENLNRCTDKLLDLNACKVKFYHRVPGLYG